MTLRSVLTLLLMLYSVPLPYLRGRGLETPMKGGVIYRGNLGATYIKGMIISRELKDVRPGSPGLKYPFPIITPVIVKEIDARSDVSRWVLKLLT